jgi:Tol biopolymer transport system component
MPMTKKTRLRHPRSTLSRSALLLAVAGVLGGLLMGAPPAAATYPGDDGRIAFARGNQIHSINPNGTGLVRLTGAGKSFRPVWSPDGRRIAYVRQSRAGANDVWLMRADGSGKRRLTDLGTVESAPTWSPTGAVLAFGAAGKLYKIRATAPFRPPVAMRGYYTNCTSCGGVVVRTHISVQGQLAWSPDGSRIALFNHEDAYYDNAIYMYRPASGQARQSLAGGGDCCGYADWSNFAWTPAGAFGYVQVNRGQTGSASYPSRILLSGFASAKGDKSFAPSPARARVVLTNDASGTPRLFVAKRDGTGRRLLTTGYQPDWQRSE